MLKGAQFTLCKFLKIPNTPMNVTRFQIDNPAMETLSTISDLSPKWSEIYIKITFPDKPGKSKEDTGIITFSKNRNLWTYLKSNLYLNENQGNAIIRDFLYRSNNVSLLLLFSY